MGEQRRAEATGHLADENDLLRASLGEIRERLSELEEQADRDVLVPLANGRRFAAELGRVIAAARRHGTQAALLHVDVDSLAGIHQRHGQPARDAALIHVAKQLDALIRATDFAARIGDGAFGLLLDHLDHNSAIDTAERIGRRVGSAPLDLGGTLVRVNVTIGIAAIDGSDDAEAVLDRAAQNARTAGDFI